MRGSGKTVESWLTPRWSTCRRIENNIEQKQKRTANEFPKTGKKKHNSKEKIKWFELEKREDFVAFDTAWLKKSLDGWKTMFILEIVGNLVVAYALTEQLELLGIFLFS